MIPTPNLQVGKADQRKRGYSTLIKTLTKEKRRSERKGNLRHALALQLFY